MKRKQTTKQLLIEAADFLDKKYNTQSQRINFAEYIDHNEFELALDSLLELSDEVEDRFEYGFWLNLELAANKMKLTDHEKKIKQKISNFWYEDAEKFKLKDPEIEATVYYLTEIEGGRSTFVYSGYRGTFLYGGQYNSAAQQFIEQVKCEPGETVRAFISFAAPEAQIGRLYEGLKFKITEGERLVGIGNITRILRQDLAKN
jgi:Elongation factor Tu C-terminal domain